MCWDRLGKPDNFSCFVLGFARVRQCITLWNFRNKFVWDSIHKRIVISVNVDWIPTRFVDRRKKTTSSFTKTFELRYNILFTLPFKVFLDLIKSAIYSREVNIFFKSISKNSIVLKTDREWTLLFQAAGLVR